MRKAAAIFLQFRSSAYCISPEWVIAVKAPATESNNCINHPVLDQSQTC